jgi:inner membrane protein
MDTLSQAALGAAVGLAVMGRRTAPPIAAAVGAVTGILPDLDAFYDRGDPISNMTFHRASSHALFWQTLASLPLAVAAAGLLREMNHVTRWWLAIWLVLVTHALLDWMTVYGTQLGLPFTDHPFAVGSMFIIDPLYTLPLLIGIGAALALRNRRGWRWNVAGLTVSTLYLGWSALAQHHVESVAQQSLRASGQEVERLLVTPTALNTILWRVVAVTPQGYLEGFHSVLDRERRISFDLFPRGENLYELLRGYWHVERMAWFTRGFFKMSERDGRAVITDLRMGQEPYYAFNFVVAARQSQALVPVHPLALRERHDIATGLSWIWRRAMGETLPPPR